jgi:hypothetical protein
MNHFTRRPDRVREVRRIFEEQGFGNGELLDGWDGVDLAELVDLLTEEEYQTLLDELEPEEERVS